MNLYNCRFTWCVYPYPSHELLVWKVEAQDLEGAAAKAKRRVQCHLDYATMPPSETASSPKQWRMEWSDSSTRATRLALLVELQEGK